MTPWILISIVAFLIIVLAVVYSYRNKEKKPTDYRQLFNIGIIWLAIGLVSKLVFGYDLEMLTYLGIVFVIAGLANKSKWKQC